MYITHYLLDNFRNIFFLRLLVLNAVQGTQEAHISKLKFSGPPKEITRACGVWLAPRSKSYCTVLVTSINM